MEDLDLNSNRKTINKKLNYFIEYLNLWMFLDINFLDYF